jgi:hypothetical protein
MSADNWAQCPQCLNKAEESDAPIPVVGWTFREDYDISGAESGTIHVEYRGRCYECGAHCRFQFTAPVEAGNDPTR